MRNTIECTTATQITVLALVIEYIDLEGKQFFEMGVVYIGIVTTIVNRYLGNVVFKGSPNFSTIRSLRLPKSDWMYSCCKRGKTDLGVVAVGYGHKW